MAKYLGATKLAVPSAGNCPAQRRQRLVRYVDAQGTVSRRGKKSAAPTSTGHISSHHISMRARIWSRILRVPARRSSRVPMSAAGSAKLQCNRFATPGKIGQRSALVSSQTVITYENNSPDLKTSNTD